jgi:hypothetical protein
VLPSSPEDEDLILGEGTVSLMMGEWGIQSILLPKEGDQDTEE